MHKTLMAAALAAATAIAAPAHATNVALAADGTWSAFDVDASFGPTYSNAWIDNTVDTGRNNDGSRLSFTFTIPVGDVGTLTVVDAGFAGDTFAVTNFGALLGSTSAVPLADTNGPLVFDFDAALADPTYSRGVFTLSAGSYSISGSLVQSTLIDLSATPASPLDATFGGVRLTVSAIPEPTNAALLLAGLGIVGAWARRRQSAIAK